MYMSVAQLTIGVLLVYVLCTVSLFVSCMLLCYCQW